MAKVQSLTAARMMLIESNAIVAGTVNTSGNLILTTMGGTSFNAGYVKGADANVTQSTESVIGITRYASNSEAVAGTSSSAATTPASVQAAITDRLTIYSTKSETQGVVDQMGRQFIFRFLFDRVNNLDQNLSFYRSYFESFDAKTLEIHLFGGGGGGGGAYPTATGQNSIGGGGGGGGYVCYLETVANLPTTITYRVGSGGGSSASSNGANGGNTSFNGVIAHGGGGGKFRAATGVFSAAAGGIGGTTTLPSGIEVQGQESNRLIWQSKGNDGLNGAGQGALGFGGNGGASYYGAGAGRGGTVLTTGSRSSGDNGTGYGSGGGGAAVAQSAATGIAGANGSSGAIMIDLYR